MKARIHRVEKIKQEVTNNSHSKVELYEVQGDGGFD